MPSPRLSLSHLVVKPLHVTKSSRPSSIHRARSCLRSLPSLHDAACPGTHTIRPLSTTTLSVTTLRMRQTRQCSNKGPCSSRLSCASVAFQAVQKPSVRQGYNLVRLLARKVCQVCAEQSCCNSLCPKRLQCLEICCTSSAMIRLQILEGRPDLKTMTPALFLHKVAGPSSEPPFASMVRSPSPPLSLICHPLATSFLARISASSLIASILFLSAVVAYFHFL